MAAWKAVEWPIRQAIKGIYLLFSRRWTARTSRRSSWEHLLLFTTGGVVLYRALFVPDTVDAHITTQANLPPLPAGVNDGFRTYNRTERGRDRLAAAAGHTTGQLRGGAAAQLNSSKSPGVEFQELLYGGYAGSRWLGR